jgi:hypothetical protein
MTEIRIRGGAGEYEAAAVAAVVAYLLELEEAAASVPPSSGNVPPAWMRAVMPTQPGTFNPPVFPEQPSR